MNDERGAAAIIVTIIMLAVAMLVVSTTALIGLDDLDTGYASQTSNDSILSAQSCVEEAITRLTRDSSYTGGTLDVGGSQCSVSVTGAPCGSCTIQVESVKEQYTRKLEVDVTLTGSTVEITNWEEID